MNLAKGLERFFGLSDEVWLRHSNKWSVWTRFFVLPMLAAAIWSRAWIDWYCLVPIALISFWTWINPRFFSKPETTKHWASKAVLGERVWLKKTDLAIPVHHLRAILVLNCVTAAGLPFFIWGLYQYEIWPTLFGLCLVILGKMWFLDRMVWIFEDMKSKSQEYSSWEY